MDGGVGELVNFARTAETLTLKTGITLAVRSASFRRIRGVTQRVLADECVFGHSDESANPMSRY